MHLKSHFIILSYFSCLALIMPSFITASMFKEESYEFSLIKFPSKSQAHYLSFSRCKLLNYRYVLEPLETLQHSLVEELRLASLQLLDLAFPCTTTILVNPPDWGQRLFSLQLVLLLPAYALPACLASGLRAGEKLDACYSFHLFLLPWVMAPLLAEGERGRD